MANTNRTKPRRKKLTFEEQEIVFESMMKEPDVKILDSITIRLKCKSENQKKLVKLIKDRDITFCAGLPGTGKAQPLDSEVLTPNGYVKMGDLQTGDLVLTPFGKPSQITSIHPQGAIDIFKISFSDGTSTECCANHLWETQTALDRRYQKFNRVDGKKVFYGDIGRIGSVKTTECIADTLNYHGKTNHSIPITEAIEFGEKNLPIDPYLLGLLLGDGGLTTNIALTTIDESILNYAKNTLSDDYKFNKNGDCTYKIVTDRGKTNPLLIELEKMGLRRHKSETKFIPELYKISSIGQRIELLQGLMDTDGSIDKRTGAVMFYSTSKQLSDDVRFLVESLGGTCGLGQKIGKYKKDGKVIPCKICYILSITLPNNISAFKLERKLKYYKPKTKYTPKRFITNVEYVGVKEAQCITIDDDRHLYLTNNFIVTHNTYLACAVALELLKQQPDRFKKIVIVKSVTTVEGEEIGYLKGTQDEKMKPFMYSFIHNFEKIIGGQKVEALKVAGMIEELPIAYMRGINIDNAVIIIDETQNLTKLKVKTIMTRLGEGSKLIFLGDTDQVDMKKPELSALRRIMTEFGKEKYKEISGSVILGEDDIVRHQLIKIILAAFDEIDKELE